MSLVCKQEVFSHRKVDIYARWVTQIVTTKLRYKHTNITKHRFLTKKRAKKLRMGKIMLIGMVLAESAVRFSNGPAVEGAASRIKALRANTT